MSRFVPPTFKDSNDSPFANGGTIGGMTGTGGAGFAALAAGGTRGGGAAMTGADFGTCSFAAGTAGMDENGADKADALCAAAAARGFRLALMRATLQRSQGSRSSACCAISRNGCGRDSGTEGWEAPLGCPPG